LPLFCGCLLSPLSSLPYHPPFSLAVAASLARVTRAFAEADAAQARYSCSVCLDDDLELKDMFTMDCPLSHRFCFDCIRREIVRRREAGRCLAAWSLFSRFLWREEGKNDRVERGDDRPQL
jgi:hypothetical protein